MHTARVQTSEVSKTSEVWASQIWTLPQKAMDLQHVNAKIYVDGDLTVDLERFIEAFHRWVAEQSMDEMLIDVADYRHVPAGPGVVLVGHEADYAMDNAGNRWGLLYNRKAPLDGGNHDRFRQALRSAANACQLLETLFEAEGQLKFSRREFALFINDRALAPNTPDTYAACKPELEGFLKGLLGHEHFNLAHDAEPRRRFGVIVSVAQPFDLDAIQEAAR